MKTKAKRAASVPMQKDNGIRLHLARTLKTWRLAHKLPLKVMAAKTGVAVSTLSQWENGVMFPSAENLALLAAYTGLTACKLVCSGHDCQHPCRRSVSV
jgi:DNA-binding transcriptional regulator YiaG